MTSNPKTADVVTLSNFPRKQRLLPPMTTHVISFADSPPKKAEPTESPTLEYTKALLSLSGDRYKFALAFEQECEQWSVSSKIIRLLAEDDTHLSKHLNAEETKCAIIAAENCGLDFNEMDSWSQ